MDTATCRRQALDLLARREHSRLEMQRKLTARAHPSDTVTEVLDSLESEGLIDHGRFAESFVRSRAGRGQGPLRIRPELTQRGVSQETIDEYLSAPDFDWCSLARRVRSRKFGTAVPSGYKERAQQMRFLQYRGFDSDHIRSALDAGRDSD